MMHIRWITPLSHIILLRSNIIYTFNPGLIVYQMNSAQKDAYFEAN